MDQFILSCFPKGEMRANLKTDPPFDSARFYFVLFLAKHILSVSMLVMSLISGWSVNFRYFTYVQILHIYTHLVVVIHYYKINYICSLHIKFYIDRFFVHYIIIAINVINFLSSFFQINGKFFLRWK